MELEFPIDPTDTAIGVMEQREHRAESASIERFFRPTSVAVIGASRRQDTIGQALVRNLVLGDFTGRVYVVNPQRRRGLRDAGVQVGRRHPRRGRRRDRRRAGRVGAGRRARLRRQGRARPGRDLLRLRRDRRGGPAAAAAAGRAVALLRPAADRPQRARHHQHRPRRLAQRLALVGDAAPRPRRLLLPVRRARLGDPREGAEPRPRPLDVRQRRQPRRRVRQRPPAVLGGGRRHRGRAALPRVDRQPAQVLPHRATGQPPQADHRGALGPQHPGRADGPRRAQDRGAAARRWTRCSARPGSSRSRRSRRCSTSPSCSPTSRCRGGAGSRSSATPTPSGCSPPTPPTRVGLVVNKPGRARRRRDRRGLRGRPRRRDRRPRGRRRGRGLHPAAQRRRRARTSPTCSPPSASSPTSRSSRRSSAPRASPSCCGCPTSPAPAPAAARCRRTPPSRPPSAPSPASSSTPCGCACRRRRSSSRGSTTSTRPASLVNEVLMRHPEGRDLDLRRAVPRCSAAYGIDLWDTYAVATLEEAHHGRRGAGLGRRPQGDRRPPARAAGPGPRVAQHRHARGDGGGLARRSPA